MLFPTPQSIRSQTHEYNHETGRLSPQSLFSYMNIYIKFSLIIVASLLFSLTQAEQNTFSEGAWIPTWVSSQQLTEPHNLPPSPGLNGNTIRQIIQPKLSGSRLRVVFSNAYGDTPLTINGAHIAKSVEHAIIDSESDVTLLFDHQPITVIQPGSIVYSDPVDFNVVSFQNLAVSVLASNVSNNLTGHPGSRTTSYIQVGDALSATDFSTAAHTDHWYLLTSIEVWANPNSAAIVMIGDSITDGRGSITNKNNRWPDVLAHRLHAKPQTKNISVLNQGVGGGRVLRDGLGTSAIARFDRDVLAQPRVKWLIVFIGVNDIGTATGARANGLPAATTQDLIAAYRQMIVRAHSHNIQVIGATIMPFGGSFYDTAESDIQRQEVNHWIRTSGEFDALIDFDKITQASDAPSKLSPDVDGGDHLHPSVKGHQIMANAIDLKIFTQ